MGRLERYHVAPGQKLFLGDITHGGNHSNNSVDDGGNDDGPEPQPTQLSGHTQPSQEGSVSAWALDYMLELLESQPSQLQFFAQLKSRRRGNTAGSQPTSWVKTLDSQLSQMLPYFSLYNGHTQQLENDQKVNFGGKFFWCFFTWSYPPDTWDFICTYKGINKT